MPVERLLSKQNDLLMIPCDYLVNSFCINRYQQYLHGAYFKGVTRQIFTLFQ